MLNWTRPSKNNRFMQIGAVSELRKSNSSQLTRCLDETDILSTGDFRFIVEVYFVGIFCLIGFIGNSLTIAVLRRETAKKNVTNWLLQMLSIFDLAFLVTAFLLLTIKSIVLSTVTWPQLRGQFRGPIIFIWPLAGITNLLTIWMVVLITVDRYLAICRPMQVRWRRLRLMKTAVLVIAIVSVLLNIPRYFQWKIEHRNTNEDDYEVVICLAKFFQNPYYQFLYLSACGMIFYSIGPFVILLFLNLFIVLELRALNRKRREITSGAMEERNLTIMLVAVVVVFVICQLPGAVIDVIYKTGVYFPVQFNRGALPTAVDISDALLVLNSSVNFFLYCLIWKKFNRILYSLMQCSEMENEDYCSGPKG